MQNEASLICRYCDKECQHLGSHLWHAHKVKAREYKKEFGLDYKHSLTSPEVQAKHKAATKKSPTWKQNFRSSKQYQFQKGHNVRKYFSDESLERCREQSAALLNQPPRKCYVCGMMFNNLVTHLREKHGLVSIINNR